VGEDGMNKVIRSKDIEHMYTYGHWEMKRDMFRVNVKNPMRPDGNRDVFM
jgi:hypothetical protein